MGLAEIKDAGPEVITKRLSLNPKKFRYMPYPLTNPFHYRTGPVLRAAFAPSFGTGMHFCGNQRSSFRQLGAKNATYWMAFARMWAPRFLFGQTCTRAGRIKVTGFLFTRSFPCSWHQ